MHNHNENLENLALINLSFQFATYRVLRKLCNISNEFFEISIFFKANSMKFKSSLFWLKVICYQTLFLPFFLLILHYFCFGNKVPSA